jgi:hypothetical protein
MAANDAQRSHGSPSESTRRAEAENDGMRMSSLWLVSHVDFAFDQFVQRKPVHRAGFELLAEEQQSVPG